VTSHLGLEVLEKASFLGSSELINFVDISSVVTKIGLLATITFLNVSSASNLSVSNYSLLDDGLSALVVNVSLVVDVALAESLS